MLSTIASLRRSIVSTPFQISYVTVMLINVFQPWKQVNLTLDRLVGSMVVILAIFLDNWGMENVTLAAYVQFKKPLVFFVPVYPL